MVAIFAQRISRPLVCSGETPRCNGDSLQKDWCIQSCDKVVLLGIHKVLFAAKARCQICNKEIQR